MRSISESKYARKGCYTPIWGNEIDMDWIFVLPVGWKWYEMYLWLLPNKIGPYLVWTFTSMPSRIVEVQNHSLGGHFPKSAFVLWQVWINNWIFFSQSSLIVQIMPRPTSICIRHKVLALAHEGIPQNAIAGRICLTRATVDRILWRHASTGTLHTTFFQWKYLNSDWYYIEVCFKGIIYNKSALHCFVVLIEMSFQLL